MAAGDTGRTGRTGDPYVVLAFRLGWHIAELYHGESARRSAEGPPESPDNLPGISRLTAAAQAQVLLRQIQTELHLLTQPCAPAGVKLPDADTVERALADQTDPKPLTLALHKALLTELTAADFRFGKAYGLGRALAETALLPDTRNRDAYGAQFGFYRAETLRDWLDDLSSAFPDHAARAVSETLAAWRDWVSANGDGIVTADAEHGGRALTDALHSQGRLWRALLSGEKRAGDILRPHHYVIAAKNLGGDTWRMVAQFLVGWWIPVLAIVAAVGGLLYGVFDYLSGSAKTAALILTVLGGLGVSWRGIGRTVGQTLRDLETPLWETELAATISRAAGRLPANGWPAGSVQEDGALALPQGTPAGRQDDVEPTRR